MATKTRARRRATSASAKARAMRVASAVVTPKQTNAPAPKQAPPTEAPVTQKPSRMEKFMQSIESVQEPRFTKKPPSRGYKIGLWAVMLMPVYAIVIYIVGFFVLLPAEVQGVGVAKALPSNVQMVEGGIAVPDHEGVFLQTNADPHQILSELQQFNDSGLQPPRDQQLILAPTGLHYIVFRDAQVSQPSDYKVYLLSKSGETLITTAAVRVPAPKIAEIALAMPKGAAWAPGSYMIDYLVAGMAPEDAYCFFTISATGK